MSIVSFAAVSCFILCFFEFVAARLAAFVERRNSVLASCSSSGPQCRPPGRPCAPGPTILPVIAPRGRAAGRPCAPGRHLTPAPAPGHEPRAPTVPSRDSRSGVPNTDMGRSTWYWPPQAGHWQQSGDKGRSSDMGHGTWTMDVERWTWPGYMGRDCARRPGLSRPRASRLPSGRRRGPAALGPVT